MEAILSSPAVLVFVVGGAIAVGIWLVRLEGRVNAIGTEKDKYREALSEKLQGYEEDLKDLEDELKDTRTRFFEHAANAAVHHNAESYGDFKIALQRRLLRMEGSLNDISLKLDQIRNHQLRSAKT